ncbi:MAG: hypothetical protein E7109_09625 [Bacteroidales bacterium]|nr:hypothetical protein [Bacteroidales bacterium]
MKKILFSILLLSISPNLIAQEVWSIAWLKPSPVRIGGKVMTVGSEFEDNERIEIQWISQEQVMKVIEKESHRMLVLCAKGLPDKKTAKLKEYINVSRKLSTRNIAYTEGQEAGRCSHYIAYEENGEMKTLIPYDNMFMDELPEEIWLCYVATDTHEAHIETKDFRAFVDDLLITDSLVKRQMSETPYDEGMYLSLMSQFLDKPFRNIPLSVKEIQTYLTLKY